MLSQKVLRTPLLGVLEAGRDQGIYLKPENLQPFGSYKIRGISAILNDGNPELLKNGLVAASAGNMAQAVAFAARLKRLPCRIFLPESAPAIKKDAIRKLGAEVMEMPFSELWRLVVDGPGDRDPGYFIHPSRNELLLKGYGKIAEEILEDLPDVEAVVVPFGVGGLTLGLCRAFERIGAPVKVIAVEPETAAPYSVSCANGHASLTQRLPSFVDAIGTPQVLPDVFEEMRRYSVESSVVPLVEIESALRDILLCQKLLVEGAAAAALAGARRILSSGRSRKVVAILSGGNIGEAEVSRILGN